jgi:O-antigen ligase
MIAFTVFAMYRHYYLGFTFANINDALQPYFRNHVNYSAMLVCTVPVLVAIYQLHKRSRIFLEIISLFVLAALFLSYARGAWLALILGAVTYWLIANKKFFAVFVTGFAFLFAALIWIKSNDRYLAYAHDFRTTIFHKNFSEHLTATVELKDVSTAERFNRWVAGVKMIDDNWLTGYGPNTFYQNYKPYMIPAFKTWVSANEDHSTVHNYFLLTTIEQGLPGLIFFLLLLGAMVWYAQHLYHRIEDVFYKTVAMCIGVLLVMIITVNMLSDLIETDKVGGLFFLCLGLLAAIDRNTKEVKFNKGIT